MDVWDPNNPDEKHRIETGNPQTIDWGKYVPTFNWICDGMPDNTQTSSINGDTSSLYVLFYSETKGLCLPFGKTSGRISWETSG